MNFKNMDFLMLFVAFLIGYLFNYIIKKCSVIEGLGCRIKTNDYTVLNDIGWYDWIKKCCGRDILSENHYNMPELLNFLHGSESGIPNPKNNPTMVNGQMWACRHNHELLGNHLTIDQLRAAAKRRAAAQKAPEKVKP